MNYYEVKQIKPWLYSIYDPQQVFCYLAVGDTRALLYDTVYGLAPLTDTIREITDKPFDVVLSHGHIDHVNGAYQFEEVWLHEGDFQLYQEHSSKTVRIGILERLAGKELNLPDGLDTEAYVNGMAKKIKKLPVGHVFDLGNLQMEVVGMEGHTSGSVGLLAKEHRILLNGDAANNHSWMYLDESLPLSRYVAMLERTMQLEFDTFFVGHSNQPFPKAMFEKFINVAKNVTIEKSQPYESIPGLKGFFYMEGDVGIVVSKKTLGQN